MLSRFLLTEVSTTQVQRLTNTYGQLLESEAAAAEEPPAVEAPPLKAEEVAYAQCDGSMILSREEGYKEVKGGASLKKVMCWR